MTRLRGEGGYTLIEMLTVLVIFGTVMSALLALFVQGTNAELDLNNRFQAQQDARLALDKLRREAHCASAVTVSSASSVGTSSSSPLREIPSRQTTSVFCTNRCATRAASLSRPMLLQTTTKV